MINQHDYRWVNAQRQAAGKPPLTAEEFEKRGMGNRSRWVDADGYNALGLKVLGPNTERADG